MFTIGLKKLKAEKKDAEMRNKEEDELLKERDKKDRALHRTRGPYRKAKLFKSKRSS